LQFSLRPFLSGSPTRISIAAIALVVIVAFGSYLAVQTATENNVRHALLDQQMKRQVDNTASISNRIAADLDAVAIRMQLVANNPVIQNGDFASQEATELLVQQYEAFTEITYIDGFGIIDQNDILVNTAVEEQRQFIGSNLSDREYVIKTKAQMKPYVSPGFNTLGEAFGFVVSVPIINSESRQYVGMMVARFLVPQFFDGYQEGLQISRIVAFDRDQTYIATTVPELLGENFWGERVQAAPVASPQLNAVYTSVFSGKPASTIFISGFTHDERFVSAEPVFYQGEQVMSVAITTPTAAIYAQVNDILFVQKIQIVAAMIAVVAAISVLILFMARWNRTLDSKVKQRTAELEVANERLREHDKLQKEFINIAAHELRTPIQPMLGITELMSESLDGKDKIEVEREYVEMLTRNANRLERLSFQLLEMARVEGGSVKLNLEPIDISTKIRNVIADAKKNRAYHEGIEIQFIEPSKPLIVHGDKVRLFEVLANLLGNAIKFTKHGSITISAQPSDDEKQVIVKISDTGTGIDPDLMPRLFTKFATKSDSGTGIGLYLAKNFIEVHGGKIWAENNPAGAGATFAFSLPLAEAMTMPISGTQPPTPTESRACE
jgi:signal transduction histidine kinase